MIVVKDDFAINTNQCTDWNKCTPKEIKFFHPFCDGSQGLTILNFENDSERDIAFERIVFHLKLEMKVLDLRNESEKEEIKEND